MDNSLFVTLIFAGLGLAIILLLSFGFVLIVWLIAGAGIILAMALELGLIGLVLLGIAWTFLLPFMIIVSLLIGWFSLRDEECISAYGNRQDPPNDEAEK